MFSIVRVPGGEWDEESMKYLLCAFPLVGALIGALCWGFTPLCSLSGQPPMIRGLGLCLIPPIITGGIHLDGLCDTWDALASYGSVSKKKEILRDPHIGSFAVFKLTALLLSQFVLWTALKNYRPWPVLGSFVLSRSLSALALVTFPVEPSSHLARTFSDGADQKRTRKVTIIIAVLAAALMSVYGGGMMVLAALGVFAWYRYKILPSFGGLSGDLAGWFVQMAEMWMLIALYVF